MKFQILACIIGLVLFAGAVHAQTNRCVAFSALGNSATYLGVVPSSTLLYVPAASGVTETTLETLAAGTHLFLSTITDSNCRTAYARFVAANIFKPCQTAAWNNGAGAAYPLLTCKSECQAIATSCSAVDSAKLNALLSNLITSNSATSLLGAANTWSNCNAANNIINGVDNYPTSTYVVSSVTFTCNSFPSPVTVRASARCMNFSSLSASVSSKALTFTGVIPAGADIYIPSTETAASLEAKASPLSLVLSGLSTDSCRNAFARLMASKIFMTCDPTVKASYIYLPQLPCQSACSALTTACGTAEYTYLTQLLTGMGQASLINCAAVGSVLPNVADYPATSTSFGGSLATSCATITATSNTSYARCATWSSLSVHNTSVFAGVIPGDASIYLPAYAKRDDAVAYLESNAAAFTLVLSGIQNDICRETVAKVYASKIYMKCDSTMKTLFNFALPRLPCKSSCQAIYASCPSNDLALVLSLLSMGGSAHNCSAQGLVLSGQDDWPSSRTNFSSTVFTTCTSLSGSDAYNPTGTDYSLYSYPTCRPYTGSICRGVTSGLVYFPARTCQQQMEDVLTDLPSLLAVVSPTCAKHTANMMCNTVYMPCMNVSLHSLSPSTVPSNVSPLPLPRFPARSLCNNMHANCPGYKSLIAGSTSTMSVLNATARSVFGNSFTATQFEQLMVSQKLFGYWPNFSADGNILKMLLGSNFVEPACDQATRAPSGQPDYPIAFTSVGGIPIPANTGSAFSDIVPQIARCEPFNSAAIIEAAKLKAATDPVEMNLIAQFKARTIPPTTKEMPDWHIASYCRNVIPEGYPVYLPAGYNMTYLNELARQIHWLFAATPRGGGCNVAFAKYACSQIFNKCNSNLATTTLATIFPNLVDNGGFKLPATLRNANAAYANLSPNTGDFSNPTSPYTLTLNSAFPSFPCKSVCLDFETKCKSFLADQPSNSSLIPNCNKRKLAPSGPLYDETKVTACNGTVTIGGQPDFPYPISNAIGSDPHCPDGRCNGTWFKTLYIADGTYLDSPANNIRQLPLLLVLRSECNSMSHDLRAEDIPYICPYPLVNPAQTDKFGRPGNYWTRNDVSDSSCALPCPSLLYDADQYKQSQYTITITTYLSFPLLIYMMMTWIVFPEKRAQRFILFFNITTLLTNISIFMGLVNDFDRTSCKNITDTYRFEFSLCSFQGFLLQFAALSAVAWWLVQALDLWLKVVIEYKPSKRSAELKDMVYHILAWGFPSISVAVMAALDSSEYLYNGLPWCFGGSINDDLTWGLFYIPVGIMAVLGCTFMSMIIASVCRSTIRSQGSAFKKGAWMVHLRPILFVLCFLLIFVFIFSYRFYGWINWGMFKDGVISWIKCHFVTQPSRMYVADDSGNFDISSQCPLRQDNAPSLGFFLFIQFAVGAQGIAVFALYGTMSDNIKLWAAVLGCRVKTGRSRYEGQSQADSKNGSVAGSVTSAVSKAGGSKVSKVELH